MAFGDLKGTPLSVAANSVTNPTSATGSVALVAGDLIYAVCAEQTSTTATACSDNLGNTYTATQAGTVAGAAVAGRAFWARAAANGTLTSVNFTCTASSNNVVGIAAVIEGPFVASPLDANPTNVTQDNTTPYTCPTTPTLAQASESVLCWIVHNGAPTFTATSPNTAALQLATQSVLKLGIGRQTVSATTAVAPAWTSSATPTSSVYGTTSFKADTAKTIVGDPGSYSISGQTVGLLSGHLQTADAGSYAVTGADVTLTWAPYVPPPAAGPWGSPPFGYVAWGGMTPQAVAASYTVAADAGSYTITGQDAGLLLSRVLVASAGAYTITGTAASLLKNEVEATNAGTYTVTGQDVVLLAGHLVVAAAGSYAITGQAASLLEGRVLVANAGAYSITGQTANLLEGRVVVADAGSYAVTGQTANLLEGRVVAATAGSYAISGQAVSLLYGALIVANAGAYNVTGQDVALIKPVLGVYTIAADTGSYVVAGQDVVLLHSSLVTAQAGSYAVSGQSVALIYTPVGHYTIAADAGSYAITGQIVSLIYTPAAPIAPASRSGHWQDWAPARARVRGTVDAQETALADRAHIEAEALPLPPPPIPLGDVALAEAGGDLADVAGQVWIGGTLRSFEQGADRASGRGRTMSVTIERSRGRITRFHFDLVENSLTLRSFEQGADTALIIGTKPEMPEPDPEDDGDVLQAILMAAMHHV